METDYNSNEAMRMSKEEDYGTEGQSLIHRISNLKEASDNAMKSALNNAGLYLTKKKIKTNNSEKNNSTKEEPAFSEPSYYNAPHSNPRSAVNSTNVKTMGGVRL